MRLSLSLEHGEATVGLVTGPTSTWLCLRGQGGPSRGRETGERPVSGVVRTHTTFMDEVYCITWVWFVAPQTNYNGSIKDRQSQVTTTNIIIMKFLKYDENYQNMTQRQCGRKCCWENDTSRLARMAATKLQFVRLQHL